MTTSDNLSYAWLTIRDVATGAAELQDKRLRVLQLHIEELTRQKDKLQQQNDKLRQTDKDYVKQRAQNQQNERKLFSRIEQLQTELKTAKEHRTKAEAHSVELQAQLEQVVMAAETEADKPDQQELVRVTTQQLEATNTLLLQAQESANAADERTQRAEADAEEAAQRELQARRTPPLPRCST